jgi:predicted dehydrogenase
MRSKSRGNKISSKDSGQRQSECPLPYLAQRRGGNGTEGSLQIPDPNYFGGRVRLLQRGGSWADMPLTHGYNDRNYRILGVAEMAAAIQKNRPHRASDQIALHAVEVMEAIVTGGSSGKAVSINSYCERPRALEPLPRLGTLD